MLKKCRIQLFDDDFNQLTDKLVAQDGEFYKGLEGTHTGPMKLEVCLFDVEDIDKVIDYIKRLKGVIPLQAKKSKKVEKASFSPDDTSARDEFYNSIISGNQPQVDIITKLRKEGFIAMYAEEFSDRGLPIPKVPEGQEEALSKITDPKADNPWVVFIRRIKEAKSAENDKFDPSMLFYFKLNAVEKSARIFYAFLVGAGLEKVSSTPTDKVKEINLKVVESAKFPSFMTLEEREKFRNEMYQIRRNITQGKDITFTKLFKRWIDFVEFPEQTAWKEIIAQK